VLGKTGTGDVLLASEKGDNGQKVAVKLYNQKTLK
jgi:hypothetical protein